MKKEQQDPVIFVGMHRSGTSLLGRLLERLGLFLGKKKDENNEAFFFLELNKWLMSQCGARWDNPEPIYDLWNEKAVDVFDASKKYACFLMRSPSAIQYLGFRLYIKYRSIINLDAPWGWKDPQNTFTLPFWLQVFPDAKVVFIERHGVDVTESLRVRARLSIEKKKRRYEIVKPIVWMKPKQAGFSESLRCLSLEGGFSLWESYQKQARRILAVTSAKRLLRVRYERLLVDPQAILREASSFCGVPANEAQVQEIANSVNPERAFSYRRDEDLLRFAEANKERLRVWGYHP